VKDEVRWQSEIDSLVFSVEKHAAFCAVHRRAFRALLGSEPTPADRLSYFGGFEDAFRVAASVKIAQKGLPVGRNFHLTSRDIARKLVELELKERGEQ
jgi:hypothetical protein